MKKLLVAALATAAVGSAMAQPSIGLSLGINEPGVYGQINIGALPAPALVAPRPVIITPGVASVPPAYLYVPLAEQRNWRRYCAKYDACGRPVYFVREDWLRDRYAHEHPGWDHRGPAGRHGERLEKRPAS
ncbi:MAG TPA: hypothetical protein VJO99_21450 [Burkholderiaceae bacterium]|nr:hypothetical protein [Burkholderiaceae bacterium]